MPVVYDVVHTTVYRYRQAVSFGEHRVMFRPRESHDLRVLATDLQVSPPSRVRMIQDPHSNSVALVQPLENSDELRIVCRFTIEHAHSDNLELPLSPSAEFFPFAYGLEERFDLEPYLRPHYEDPRGDLSAWARQFIRTDGPTHTRDMVVAMNQFIRGHFNYQSRDEEGTQSPLETLKLGSGSCRDFALLMMEALRCLGIATRFVSGYLYDPSTDRPDAFSESAAPAASVASPAPQALPAAVAAPKTLGAGYTHAWLQAYLPGAGWLPFDPTNNLTGGNQLIRVGVARDPRHAAPISGVWYGKPDDYIGMTVQVLLRQRP
jgi:transglutaminase-like putative cysteine protease